MHREPVVVIAAIMSLIYMAASFGLDLTNDQTAAIEVALVAVGALWARSKVSPVE